MRKSDVEKFVEKARGFEEMAEMNFRKQRYDLAMFCFDQAAQIYIKSKLLELIGEFPRTHDIVKLLRELDVVYTENIVNFINECDNEVDRCVRYLPLLYKRILQRRGDGVHQKAQEGAGV